MKAVVMLIIVGIAGYFVYMNFLYVHESFYVVERFQKRKVVQLRGELQEKQFRIVGWWWTTAEQKISEDGNRVKYKVTLSLDKKLLVGGSKTGIHKECDIKVKKKGDRWIRVGTPRCKNVDSTGLLHGAFKESKYQTLDSLKRKK